MKGKPAAKSECVKVAVRVRPMNKREKEENSEICVSVDKENCSVSVTSKKMIQKHFSLIMFIQWIVHKEKFMIKLHFQS